MSSLPLQLPPPRLFLQVLLMRLTAIVVACAMIGTLGIVSLARAQYPVPPGAAGGPPLFSQQELDQMLAPVALYPDQLLAQVMMAATYPEEVSAAASWAAQSPNSTPDQLQAAAVNAPWDPSVKALLSFPQVLNMMAQNPQWTERLGDAFLGQQDQAMQTVQGLRQRARAAGMLNSSPQQNVVVDGSYISIEPPRQDYIYVPEYDPNVVYGSWWWPSAPPVYFAPPPGISFNRGYYWGAGIAAGVALWGYFNWRQHNVAINVTRYNRFHPTHIQSPVWSHNPAHRGDVQYRQPDVRARFQQRADEARRQAPRQAPPPPPRAQPGADHRGPQPGADHRGSQPGADHRGPQPGPDHRGPQPGADHRGPQLGADHRGPPGQQPGAPGRGPENDRRGPPGAAQQRAPAALVSPPVAQPPAQHPAPRQPGATPRGPQMERPANAEHRGPMREAPHAPAAAPQVPHAPPAPRAAPPQMEHRAPPQAAPRPAPQAPHAAPQAAPHPPQAAPQHGGPPPGHEHNK